MLGVSIVVADARAAPPSSSWLIVVVPVVVEVGVEISGGSEAEQASD